VNVSSVTTRVVLLQKAIMAAYHEREEKLSLKNVRMLSVSGFEPSVQLLCQRRDRALRRATRVALLRVKNAARQMVLEASK
jgi:hypothetical protein